MKKLKAIGAMCIALYVIVVVLIPTALSYQDLEYMDWAIEKDDMSSFYISKITSALCRDDMSSLKLYSDLSYNFHSDALDEMDNFDISPGYLSIYRDERKAVYEDMKWTAYYQNKMADALLSGEGYNDYYFQMVKSHLESATSHSEKAMEYLEKYSPIVNVGDAATYYVNPGDSIQSAVNAASPGDTIIVKDGNYTENINVNKLLTVRSENGYENCRIQAANPNDPAIKISTKFVTIDGFNVTGVTGNYKAGIYGYGVEHCTISNNNALNNHLGINLETSSNNVITNNIVSNNYINIYLNMHSLNNKITNNIVSKNDHGILLHGGCSYNNVYGNIVSNTIAGIHIRWDSTNNRITRNNMKSNSWGIGLQDGAKDNIIYLNNFINNNQNPHFEGYAPLTNIWKSPELVSYTYNDNPFINYMGNYWDDYTGSDGDGDGISDSTYNMPEWNGDDYSLIVPFENYKIEHLPLAILASTKASCD